jgi:hypothetical protein
MRVKVVLQKVYVAFVLLVLLTIQVSMPVVNATDEIDGSVRSYGFNNETEISNVVITDRDGNLIDSGLGSEDLTRTSDFIIQFDVFDLDGFDHLDVYVALFNVDSNSKETTSGILAAAINSGVEDRGFVVRWMAPERSIYLSGLASGISETFSFDINSGVSNFFVKSGVSPISSGTYNSGIEDFVTSGAFNLNSSVTWEVTSGFSPGPNAVVTQSGVVNDFSDETPTSGVRNIKYTVTIPFKLSKVAPSSGVWNVGVMVHDRLQQEITEERTNVLVDKYKYASEYYKNQWYGEVEIEGNVNLTFIDVEAGSGFQRADQSGLNAIQVLFISNGNYKQQVQSDTTWNPQVTVPNRPAFAFLVSNSGLAVPSEADLDILNTSGNRFALQARRIELAGDGNISDWVNVDPFVVDGSTVNFVRGNIDSIYRTANENQIPQGNAAVSSQIGTIASAEGTNEVGVVSKFEFQLRLSSVFQNTTYSGNISIGVSNTSGEFFPNGN